MSKAVSTVGSTQTQIVRLSNQFDIIFNFVFFFSVQFFINSKFILILFLCLLLSLTRTHHTHTHMYINCYISTLWISSLYLIHFITQILSEIKHTNTHTQTNTNNVRAYCVDTVRRKFLQCEYLFEPKQQQTYETKKIWMNKQSNNTSDDYTLINL